MILLVFKRRLEHLRGPEHLLGHTGSWYEITKKQSIGRLSDHVSDAREFKNLEQVLGETYDERVAIEWRAEP